MPEFLQAILPFYAYCENYTSYLEQPFNFITCAFFWVGVSILLSQHSEDDQSPSIHEIMAGMLFVLGITGAVWHATGNQIALGLDMMFLFMLLCVAVSAICNDILDWSYQKGMGVIVVLVLLGAFLKDVGSETLPQNGAVFVPVLIFFCYAAIEVRKQSTKVSIYLLWAAYVFAFGLIMRSADTVMCGAFPAGFHFMWHIMLVGSVYYISKAVEQVKHEMREAESMTASKLSVQEERAKMTNCVFFFSQLVHRK